ncbi:hypothetical protein GUJ93_ZPchr0013g36104 [Zizania palustris]|uniref:DUF834 domain-containing protein n=1 Tax=Zizania palustris TaxID=103762 RepID=A0A8J5WWF6_ZIZPA|nr:hypothetical protein GUJ93_ZPchr0013g36104 [Zizania palustris]
MTVANSKVLKLLGCVELDNVEVTVALDRFFGEHFVSGGRRVKLSDDRCGRGRRQRWSQEEDSRREEGGDVEDNEMSSGDLRGYGVDIGGGEGIRLTGNIGGEVASDESHALTKSNPPERAGEAEGPASAIGAVPGAPNKP